MKRLVHRLFALVFDRTPLVAVTHNWCYKADYLIFAKICAALNIQLPKKYYLSKELIKSLPKYDLRRLIEVYELLLKYPSFFNLLIDLIPYFTLCSLHAIGHEFKSSDKKRRDRYYLNLVFEIGVS